MGISVINVENKKILAYKLPSHYKKEDNNIGNKLEDFIILQVLGQGTYGFVAKVKSKINLELYALKQIKFQMLDEEERKKFYNELIFLKEFNHPNVCKCFKTFEENGCYYIIMNLFNNKDLYTYVSGYLHLHMRISEEILWDIFLQCFEGLIYIHNKGVIHRDIKPANIFINDKGNVQIGDFGLSVVIDKNQLQKYTNDPQEQQSLLLIPREKRGTPGYAAPEVDNELYYDQKADVYSMGVTFYVLCFGCFPYKNGTNMVDMRNDNYYSYELKNVIFQMIQYEPNQRANLSDIYTLFRKYYIKKYVKNSGIYSAIRCLFNYDSFKNYFSNNENIFQIFQTEIPKKFAFIMVEILQGLKNKDYENSIYVLRKILNEQGINKKDNEEITPLEIISILLNTLNYELNIIIKNDLSKSQGPQNILMNLGMQNKQEEKQPINNKKYLHVKDIAGEKEKKYKEYINLYKNEFNSMISQNYPSTLIIERTCANNHTNYLFRRFHYIPFNCDLLMNKINKPYINIYDAFQCLNNNQIYLGLNKYVKCPDCNKYIGHYEKKTIYETPNNLIIFFDRGQNNQNRIKIDFSESILFNSSQVENNNGKFYNLIGVIVEVMNNNSSKYISYIKNNNNWILCDINPENDGKIIQNFMEIKNQGNVISLFYYSNLLNSPNMNINNAFNFNFNNSNENINVNYLNNNNNQTRMRNYIGSIFNNNSNMNNINNMQNINNFMNFQNSYNINNNNNNNNNNNFNDGSGFNNNMNNNYNNNNMNNNYNNNNNMNNNYNNNNMNNNYNNNNNMNNFTNFNNNMNNNNNIFNGNNNINNYNPMNINRNNINNNMNY